MASLPFGQGADAPASRTPQAPTVTTTGEPTALASLPVPSQPTTPARPPRAATGTADSSAATGWSTGWSPAPAFDEDHPEELSYRPFPIMPMLTLTASPDDPALARLTHPDPAGALALLAEPDHVPALNLRPGRQVARILWAQQFTGEAVNMDALLGSSQGPGSSAPTPGRKVRTALQ